MQYAQLDEENQLDTSSILEVQDEADAASSASRRSRRTSNGDAESAAELTQPLHDTTTPREEDPFYVFREDLYRKLDLVEESLKEFLHVVHQTDTAVNTHALKDAKKQLKRHFKNAESTLRDVQMTVQLVESQREKFSHIDNAELYDRKSLVSTAQDRLSRAKQEMNSPAVKQKQLEDERAKTLRRASAQNSTEVQEENSSFIADSAARTSLLMQQQDETLEDLDEAVMRVGEMATTIHQELDSQNKLLGEMEEDLTDAEEKLGVVMGKLGKLLKTKDKCQLGTILCLCLTVVILFFLVIYT